MQDEIEKFLGLYKAENTKNSYRNILLKYQEYSHGELLGGQMWMKEFSHWLQKRGLSNNTVNAHLIVTRKFFRYATGRTLEIELLPRDKSQIEFLSAEEVELLREGANLEFGAVLDFMLDTGVRVAELATISRTRFEQVSKEYVFAGKGGKQRIIVISDRTYNKLVKLSEYGLIFGRKWGPRAIQRNLEQLGRKVGLTKKVHPHMLRHTFATHMLWNGADISEVQKMLGHSNIGTTQIYTHVTQDRLRKVWGAYHAKSEKNF